MKCKILVETEAEVPKEAFLDLVEGFLRELEVKGRVLIDEADNADLDQALFQILGEEGPYRLELVGPGVTGRGIYLVNSAFIGDPDGRTDA